MVPFFTLSRHPEQFPNHFRDFFSLCGQKQTYDIIILNWFCFNFLLFIYIGNTWLFLSHRCLTYKFDCTFFAKPTHISHSSLVDYLAQGIYAKNCPTTFYCIFRLVWVPMTTTQNIRVCFLSSNNTLFS